MVETPLISVIITAYNVEKYIRQCIESLLAQTFASIEFILVDDGSTDRSGEICDQYAQQYERIQVIHRPNGGPSAARNAGLAIARGKYIGYVDGDDWIEPEMYQKMRLRGTELLKKAFEVNNGHGIIQESVANNPKGNGNWGERIFNDGNLNDENFLKKNLLLPVPKDEIDTNSALDYSDNNYGYTN